jgi:predicted NBD/HSP70 family sugar kinase
LAAARAQDELALTVMTEATEWLYKVLAFCTSMFNPALIVIGGGLGHAATDFFIDGLKEQIFKRTVPMSHQGLEVLESQVSNSAVGAACLVWHGLHIRKDEEITP